MQEADTAMPVIDDSLKRYDMQRRQGFGSDYRRSH